MPCRSYSLNATDCITGSRLRAIPGTVCSGCYANRNFYLMGTVRDPRDWNLAIWRQCVAAGTVDAWVAEHVRQIQGADYFRWFDSGDLQSLQMLRAIVAVARATPETLHWLPTHEAGIVARYKGSFPRNLILRVSAKYLGTYEPHPGHLTSSVDAGRGKPCSAVAGKCGPCRDCWDASIENLDYKGI